MAEEEIILKFKKCDKGYLKPLCPKCGSTEFNVYENTNGCGYRTGKASIYCNKCDYEIEFIVLGD